MQGSAGWEPDLLQVISGYWEAVGIQTQIVPMDFTAMRSAWVGKDPKIMGGVAPWMGIGSGSAANNIPAMQNHMTSKGVNISGNDPQLDKDFFAMIAELDANKRLALWHTVQQEAFALHSVLGIARVYDQYAVSSKVGEWTGIDYQSGGNSAFILGLTGVQHDERGEADLKRSVDRILTTHVGSLVRTPAIIEGMKARVLSRPYDQDTFA